MPFEQRDNSGALFKGNKTNERSPDYTGNALVNGRQMRIAAWIKTDRNGNNYMSLMFSDPAERGAAQTVPAKPAQHGDDSDVPF